MWTRAEIKDYAKGFLRENYWKAFVVCLIVGLVTGGGNSSNNRNRNNRNRNNNVYEGYYNEQSIDGGYSSKAVNVLTSGVRSPLFFFTGGTVLILSMAFLLLIVTVGYAIQVGGSRFFLDGFKGDVSIGKVFSTFNREEYWPIVKTLFLTGLYTVLWTLLFIIPGIIKSYEYRMVPYILAEKPNLSANEVISRSRDITRGHKIDIFVLDLSFIGWYLIGVLLCGIGVIFVAPYKEATEARLYNILAGNDDPKKDKSNNSTLEEDIFGDDFSLDF